MDRHADEETLRREVAQLTDEDVLALCYGLAGRLPRLRLYLDVMRRRGGSRAQFVSCLICFDLARQGDIGAQAEFVLLADTMRQLALDGPLVAELVAGDAYLGLVWDLCRAALREMDPLEAEPTVSLLRPGEREPLAELPLLEDLDLPDFGVATDDTTLWRRFDEAVATFLGGAIGVPAYERGAGFRLHGRRDVARVEDFIARTEALADLVPPARGFRALALLFYGSQLRSRSLFGGANGRKQQLLRDGLNAFVAHGPETWEVAGAFCPMHADDDAWPRIVEVLLAFVRWRAAAPSDADPDAFDPLSG